MDNYKKNFAIASLRRSSYRWRSRGEAVKAARIERGVYKCNLCEGSFGRKEINVDHISPVVPITGWDGFEEFIERLLCDEEGFQILCQTCHKAKTKAENTTRRLNGPVGNKGKRKSKRNA